MWTAHSRKVSESTTLTHLSDAAGELSFSAVLDLWHRESPFRDYFTALLRDAPFDSYFWETPPVSRNTAGRQFEFALIDAPRLDATQPEPAAFQKHFEASPSESVLRFPNLGGDAMLIVPAPRSDQRNYTHLGRFLRAAPREQIDDFWQVAAAAMKESLSAQPVWLSTAGMGVSWLHLRIDSRPKYYRYRPYAETT